MQQEPTKRCNVCSVTKPLARFWADHRKPDGRQNRCADCANRRRAETKRNGVPPKPPLYIVENRDYHTPCWIWLRGKTSKGYGGIRRDGRNQSAHRWMYERHKGPIPQGLDLDHLCRVRACVNPDHLEPVLNAENVRRGRKAKLTWVDVEAIRASDAPQAELARQYGVSATHIKNIRRGLKWSRDQQWIRPSNSLSVKSDQEPPHASFPRPERPRRRPTGTGR